jgi:hypothetical protein
LNTQIRKGIFLVLIMVVTGLSMVWLRAYHGSREAYTKGETHAQSGNAVSAIAFFDRAIRWYAPFNPMTNRAAHRLWDIGVQAKKVGNRDVALMAFRALRRAFLASTSFYNTGKDWIQKCDMAISEMTLDQERKMDEKIMRAGDTSLHDRKQPPGPHRGWSIVVVMGFLGWVGSAFGCILFGLGNEKDASVVWQRASIWCFSLALFFAIWIVGMMKA